MLLLVVKILVLNLVRLMRRFPTRGGIGADEKLRIRFEDEGGETGGKSKVLPSFESVRVVLRGIGE